ncbi:MAG: hypothetical protein AB8B84_02805 [Granulosicoccus sp.]
MTSRTDNASKKWASLPDYIIGITKEIWEDKGIATLNQYYAQDIPMRFPSGLMVGNQSVIAGTLATLAEFPDRQYDNGHAFRPWIFWKSHWQEIPGACYRRLRC